MYWLADQYVKRIIESAADVGEVGIGSSARRAVQVNIESPRLAAYGLSIGQIREALPLLGERHYLMKIG